MSARHDPPPQTGLSRAISLVALMSGILAPILFVLIFFLASIGFATAGRVLSPLALTATLFGVISAIAATAHPRTRTLGITIALVMVPCAFLGAISLIGMLSR
ncbi:MAG: hypothetical protein H7248_00640 [Microbacteriaceae bacterium]|nr:hypothetical protein [Microbacteriaceae bacterium]